MAYGRGMQSSRPKPPPAPRPFVDYFADLRDPRVVGRCDHPLVTVVVMALCAVAAGADAPPTTPPAAPRGRHAVPLTASHGRILRGC